MVAVDEHLLNSIFHESYRYKSYENFLNFTHITGTNQIDLISGLYLNDGIESKLIKNSSNIVYPGKSKINFKKKLN